MFAPLLACCGVFLLLLLLLPEEPLLWPAVAERVCARESYRSDRMEREVGGRECLCMRERMCVVLSRG